MQSRALIQITAQNVDGYLPTERRGICWQGLIRKAMGPPRRRPDARAGRALKSRFQQLRNQRKYNVEEDFNGRHCDDRGGPVP
jgi:hypothetical protein